ncbi:conserved hypothetical protein [Lodderomyces elongisporus NRRL YB-4239]|uniref:Uncharacterized protein n=1 Tax=Lodderomyces elongisporus (strain ATCC 11503 / CBS 2605 / JCM 1781 / NBRC 1676 / NRRL YB-4239) TaxID=379508 RepID=A5DSG3_LODEL|nr:conserved hypothetical protein [Lodderomyces elongisporus NRRL YB-4239]
MVNAIAAGKTKVPTNSMKITNCIEKQKVPHKSFTSTSSIKLCTVELIHLRRCDNKTLNLSGTTVLHAALGMKICFLLGNVLNINDDKYLSSPKRSKFFLCNVSTTLSEYLSTISGFAKIGTQYPSDPFGALILYIQKHPWKTRDTTKNRLKRLGLMMRNIVLKHLNSSKPMFAPLLEIFCFHHRELIT